MGVFDRVRKRLRRLSGDGGAAELGRGLDAALARDRARWEAERAGAGGAGRVLLATNVGGHAAAVKMETLLAAALTLRGARVDILLCDGVLPGCLKAQIDSLPDPGVIDRYELGQKVCPGCFARGQAAFGPLGLRILTLGGLLDEAARAWARETAGRVPVEDIAGFRLAGEAVGEHAMAGALRYFARGALAGEPMGAVVLRRYFEASLLTAAAMRTLLARERYDAACFHHGLYVPQGLVGEACRARGVRVVNWVVAYRSRSFIFSHDDTYHHTLMTEPVDQWRDMAWGDAQDRQIRDYLASRWSGARDWIYFHEKPDADFDAFIAASGIDRTKPIIGLLTNVMWDAQLHYPANAFPNMLEWVLETIRYFAGRPDLQLLIRVHPAEIRGGVRSRQPLVPEIEKAWPALPPNVFLIGPESPVSTYAAAAACDSVLVYGTKTGVELTSVGIPVIVAGEAWIRNKGLTIDATSVENYRQILDALPMRRRLDDPQAELARKYAFHFFFRRMIPLRIVEPIKTAASFEIAIDGLDRLQEGADAGLDVICSGILKGAPFVYRAEELGIHDA